MLFQKISIAPPSHRWFFLLDPPPTPLNFRSRGVIYNHHPLEISFFSFHGLNLPHLAIIGCVLLKINCSDLKTQFFIIFDLSVIFYQAICVSYTGSMLDRL